MSKQRSVSKRILNELKNNTKNEVVYKIAEEILFFEMENWRLKNPRYRRHIEGLITKFSKESE